MSRQLQAYSDLKAAWHQDSIQALRDGRAPIPKQIHLILSDLCNQSCSFCAYRMEDGFSTELFRENGNINPNRMIPTEKALEILEDAATCGARAIQFTGGGEPTVHPEHIKVMRAAQALGLETALVTNGVRLIDGWEDVFRRHAWIRVSIDAGTPETYAKVRSVPANIFEKALVNVRRIADVLAGTPCLLGVGFVVTTDNWPEIPVATALAKSAGASYIRLAAVFSKQGSIPYLGFYDEIKMAIDVARKREDNAFRVVDLFGQRIEDLDQGAPEDHLCGYQALTTYIGGDQNVYRCCTTSYTLHGKIASLKEIRLRDFWASDAWRRAVFGFDARSCEVCQFNDKNRTIGYLLNEKPFHVNFV